jgi:DNA-binding transcriptional ArsR family regulator
MARTRTRYVEGYFLRGPIPLDWLTALTDMSGKTVMTALAIWWQAGLHGKREGLKLTTAGLQRFGVDRKAKDRALKALEDAGLISVVRKAGKNPAVSILEAKTLSLPQQPPQEDYRA